MAQIKGSYNRKVGTISIRQGEVVFLSANGEVLERISLQALKVEVHHGNSTQLILKSIRKDVIFSTFDMNLIDALDDHNYFKIDELRKELGRTKRSLKFQLVVLLGIPIFAVFVIPMSLFLIPRSFYSSFVDYDDLKTFGEKIAVEYDAISVGKKADLIKKIAEDISEFNPELKKIPFTFYYSKSDVVNAFAAPGAVIVINKGLINDVKSIEELYGVIAHEMAHVYLGHNIENFISKIAPLAGIIVLEMIFQGSSALAFKLFDLADLKYSKSTELQADKYALIYLKSAGVNNLGMSSFFERKRSFENKLLSVMSTHPSSEKRIEEIRDFREKNLYRHRKLDEKILERLKSD